MRYLFKKVREEFMTPCILQWVPGVGAMTLHFGRPKFESFMGRDISFRHHFQTGCGAPVTSSSMGTREVRQSEHKGAAVVRLMPKLKVRGVLRHPSARLSPRC